MSPEEKARDGGPAALRGSKCGTPVLIPTAKDKPKDKVEGLSAGADDHLTKSFGFEELPARVRALLRRRGCGKNIL